MSWPQRALRAPRSWQGLKRPWHCSRGSTKDIQVTLGHKGHRFQHLKHTVIFVILMVEGGNTQTPFSLVSRTWGTFSLPQGNSTSGGLGLCCKAPWEMGTGWSSSFSLQQSSSKGAF